jgi:NADH-quinone oxidoreductase subunit J
MESTLFYILAVVAVAATILAITEKHPVHAIVYLVTSFFALAVVFYLLAAPLVAVFEVIIYAGAIMVLFLFVIMMLDLGHPDRAWRPHLREWWPALLLGGIVAGAVLTLAATTPAAPLASPAPDIKAFSQALFQKYGVAVEIISMQLLFAVVGALYLGRRRR